MSQDMHCQNEHASTLLRTNGVATQNKERHEVENALALMDGIHCSVHVWGTLPQVCIVMLLYNMHGSIGVHGCTCLHTKYNALCMRCK
jgi:hypothetical protein